jgi:glycosyltransferase involved in cell wall biosynthesis
VADDRHSAEGRRRPVARVFTPAPLVPSFPNGFSGRWFHFVRALTEHFDVEVVVVRGIWHERYLDGEAFRPPVPLRGFRVLDARWAPWWMVWPVRLALTPISMMNTRRFGPDVIGLPAALEPAPDVAIFLLHHVSHVAFRFPERTRCVFVFEEDLIRTHYANRTPPRFLAAPWHLWRRFVEPMARRRYRHFAAYCASRGPVVLISDEERDQFGHWVPPERLAVVPNGIDADEYLPIEGSPDHDVAIFGDFSQVRNFGPAVALIERARRRDDTKHLRWLVVGADPHESLIRLAGPDVTVTGRVPDTRPYYPRARVVLVPARIASGSKSTVLKAWSMQRPVVATPIALAGLPARPGHNLRVAADDDGLLDEVLGLIGNSDEAARMAAQGRATAVHECDQQVVARRFAQLCRDALQRTASP